MKYYSSIILLLLISSWSSAYCFSKDSLRKELSFAMNNKEKYIKAKQDKIVELKTLLSIENIRPEQEFDINMRLFSEYEKYATDSATQYMTRNVRLANTLNNNKLLLESQLLLASIYSTKGQYIESANILDKVKELPLDTAQRALLYETYSVFFSHYGQSNGDYEYYRMSSEYRDSLLSMLPENSMKYRIEYLKRLIYSTSEDFEVVNENALSILNELTDNDPDKAVVAFLLSELYKQRGDEQNQELFLMMSAITDIKNCIRDNASLQSLALVYYKQGDIKQAYSFMQEAVNDAVFCNVRYRTVEASSSYPIINALFNENQKKQQLQLMSYLVMISILSLILIIAVVFVYFQLKKVARIRKKLSQSNEELNRLNADLNNAIDNLQEANYIKEEYITHFFDRCSSYIDKLGEYKKSLAKYASTSQLDELFKMIKSNTIIDDEVEELYKTFDTIFLNLYPSFIDEFNALLIPGEEILPKHSDMLNTELRIYALIRLGITDSVKIASFLRYSLRTVYNYRTKIRNKAAGKRDDFENLVAQIGIGNVRKP